MRWLISLLFVALVAVVLALAGRNDPGYVVLVYPPWRIEISFISFVIGILLAIGLATVVLRFFAYAFSLPDRVRARRAARSVARSDERFIAGLHAWIDQRFSDAADSLGSWQGDSRRLGIARLLAARAAQRLGLHARRDAYLAEAANTVDSALAAHLFTLETALAADDTAAADRAVLAARGIAPNHAALRKLELKLAQQALRWDQAAELVDRLEKERLLAPEYAQPQRRAALIERLRRARGAAFTSLWKSTPTALKTDAAVARVAATRLIEDGEHDAALAILEAALAREWDEALVRLYGRAVGSRTDRQLDQAEKWLAQRPRDPELLLALAELCSRAALWGKAQSYLEASLAVEPGVEAHLRLAELREQTGMSNEACGHYKAALALAQTK